MKTTITDTTAPDWFPPVTRETRQIAERIVARGHAARCLDEAADKITNLTRGFDRYGLPWFAQHGGTDNDDRYQVGCQPSPAYPGSEVLIGGGYMVDDIPENTARWIGALGPQVAGALRMALRAQAELVRELPGDVIGDGLYPEQRAPTVALVCLAVEILHDEPEHDDI